MFQNEMKKFFKMAIVAFSFLGVTQTVLAQQATQGTVGGGGGFKYRDTATPIIQEAQNELIQKLMVTTQEEINDRLSKLTPYTIDKTELINIIAGMKKAPLENAPPAMVDRYIIALQPLYEWIHNQANPAQVYLNLQRKIIHETTHLFGIGVGAQDSSNNDDVSYKVSTDLHNLLFKKSWSCGIWGSIEHRKEKCAQEKRTEDENKEISKFGPLIMEYRNEILSRFSIKIYDSYQMRGYFVAKFMRESGQNDPLNAPEVICSKILDLEGLVGWKAATDEQVQNLSPKPFEYGLYDVALTDGRVRQSKSHAFRSGTFEIKKMTDKRSTYLNYYCVGTKK